MWSKIAIFLFLAGNVFCDLNLQKISLVSHKNRDDFLKLEKILKDEILDKTKSKYEKLDNLYKNVFDFINSRLIENENENEKLRSLMNLYQFEYYGPNFESINQNFAILTQNVKHKKKDNGIIEYKTYNRFKNDFDALQKIMIDKMLFNETIGTKINYNCFIRNSQEYVIFSLYDMIVTLQLKAYITMQIPLMIKQISEDDSTRSSSKFQISRLKKKYEENIIESVGSTKDILKSAKRIIKTCDPGEFKEGENFIKVVGFLQGYIDKEKMDTKSGGCKGNCSTYNDKSGNFEEGRHKPCLGKLRQCFKTEVPLRICHPKDQRRRYEYVTNNDSIIWGRERPCDELNTSDNLYRTGQCDLCACVCDGESDPVSEKSFSLLATKSNTEQNKVVTGVRFVKKLGVIYLQIQQGRLLEYGKIDQVEWVNVPKLDLTLKGIRQGKDYHELSYEKRKFYLDDLYAPQGHVVTGVKLSLLDEHMYLSIHVTSFSYETGTLVSEISRWIPPTDIKKITGNHENEISLERCDVPDESLRLNEMSKPGSFLSFTSTGFDEDMAQNTIPYFDSQDLFSIPATPLQGVGVYLKNQEGYGGFISPKIMTFAHNI